jgi:tRNA threonylcarbamoyladenosine biosynthesis protein TsaB
VLATDGGALLGEQHLDGRHLDRELPAALAALLGIAQPSAVACVLGPGSYTGLRVGIATALGLAHARDLPLHGIPALEVVARSAPASAEQIEAVADAGRGALYVARYRRAGDALRTTDPPRRVEHEEWSVAPGHLAVSLDAVPGSEHCEQRAEAGLAAAAAAAVAQPALSRAGLEPVYLGGSVARRPRV